MQPHVTSCGHHAVFRSHDICFMTGNLHPLTPLHISLIPHLPHLTCQMLAFSLFYIINAYISITDNAETGLYEG